MDRLIGTCIGTIEREREMDRGMARIGERVLQHLHIKIWRERERERWIGTWLGLGRECCSTYT